MSYSIQTLLKLANNPHFKLNSKQLAELEEYYSLTGKVKHRTGVDKHSTSIPEEE